MSKNYQYRNSKPKMFNISVAEEKESVIESQLTISDRLGNEVFELRTDGRLLINRGYTFDGATPKFRIGFICFGAWDGKWNYKQGLPELYYATMKHDALCQILAICRKKGRHINLTQAEVDLEFKRDMIAVQFKYTNSYYFLVRCYDVVRKVRRLFNF